MKNETRNKAIVILLLLFTLVCLIAGTFVLLGEVELKNEKYFSKQDCEDKIEIMLNNSEFHDAYCNGYGINWVKVK